MVKNYVATEFLYDYLKDKRSVGVIDEDRERGIQYVAEPIGVVLALTPITNPTSTVLFKAIVAAKTRNAIDLPAVGARRPLRRTGGRDPPGGRRARRPAARRAPGDPRPDARRLAVPLPPRRRRLHLDDRRAEGGRGRQRGRQAVPQRRPGQRARLHPPQRRHRDGGRRHPDLEDLRRLGDLPGRADLRRSTTRSTTRWSPSSSGWARAARPEDEVERARRARVRRRTAASRCAALGQSCVNLGAMAGLRGGRATTRCCSRRCRRDLEELARHPLVAGEADAGARPGALAVGRARASPPASWSPSTAGSATPRPSTPPTRT